MILLGEKDTSQKGFKAIRLRFMQRLNEFNKDKVTDAIMKKLKPFVTHADFNYEQVMRASSAAAYICNWILAIVEYCNAKRAQ